MSTISFIDSPTSTSSPADPMRLVAHGSADSTAAATLRSAVRAAAGTASSGHLVVVDVSDVHFLAAGALRAIDQIGSSTASDGVVVVGLSTAAQEVLRINATIAERRNLRPVV